jgi:hypothetical protein
MKVYSISTAAKPPKGRFKEYASLGIPRKDLPFLRLGRGGFSGRPFPAKWKPIEFYIDNPLLPRPDFYSLGVGAFVCNERARVVGGEPLEMTGELFPVTVEGEKGTFYVYNCTNCLNVVDPENSVWETLGEFKLLGKPAFFGERFGEESLFKIPQNGASNIYCLERSGEADDGEFKAIVEKHGLTGLEFELVWSDEL